MKKAENAESTEIELTYNEEEDALEMVNDPLIKTFLPVSVLIKVITTAIGIEKSSKKQCAVTDAKCHWEALKKTFTRDGKLKLG